MQIMQILLFGLCLLSTAIAENLLELGCLTDAQCAQFERAKCLNSYCHCTARDSDQHVDCQPRDQKLTNIIGGHCPCSQPNAECDEELQQCFCAKNFIPSKDRRRCLPQAVPLNGQCEVSRQCQLKDTFAVCRTSQNRCLCKDYFESHMGHCRALLDIECTDDTNCTNYGSSNCSRAFRKCACEIDLIHNHDKTACMSGSGYGNQCITSAQCQLKLGPGGFCHNNQCTCRPKYYAKKRQNSTSESDSTICEPIVPYGAYCRRDEDCQEHRQHGSEQLTLHSGGDQLEPQSNSQLGYSHNMQCKWGECVCRADHRVVDNEKCMLVINVGNQLHGCLPQLIGLLILFWFVLTFIKQLRTLA